MYVVEPDHPSRPLPEWERAFLTGRARSWLRAGIPLTLLLDLAAPGGPDSQSLYASETSDVSWACRGVG